MLTIKGKNLDVDAFIKKSKLKPYKIFYKEELKFKNALKNTELSGISLEASAAGFNSFDLQVKDAIKFLKKNKKKLEIISRTKEVEYSILDFGIDIKLNKHDIPFSQSQLFPVELLRLAGDLKLDIELSIYPET